MIASRTEGLRRLEAFVPHAAHAYASGRNTDNGPDRPSAVSMLSPYLRYRLISEREVVSTVLKQHSLQAAEKFVQEVLWRTYWKGWLEMRPEVWMRFVQERDRAHDQVSSNNAHATAVRNAENGCTGIEGFDDWARELVTTGYLHNHARMWFASIWIFTLRLPWSLGADFFLRHLVDADAASNTLSWRWVAGLQTAGKTYLATADNISRNTNGRFYPKGLANHADALTEVPVSGPQALPEAGHYNAAEPSLMLITHEDMHPESVLPDRNSVKSALITADTASLWGAASAKFVTEAATDCAARIDKESKFPCQTIQMLDADTLIAAAQAANVKQIITPYAPVGPLADRLRSISGALSSAGINVSQVRRSWDTQFWPHAKKGFFPFKEQIGKGLVAENVLRSHK